MTKSIIVDPLQQLSDLMLKILSFPDAFVLITGRVDVVASFVILKLMLIGGLYSFPLKKFSHIVQIGMNGDWIKTFEVRKRYPIVGRLETS